MSEVVEIFTDGACKGNPGPGGWAYLVRRKGVEYHDSGGDRNTTNNRMELTAAIRALESLSDKCHIKLYCDSELLVKGMTQWIEIWMGRSWKLSSGKPVDNQDLWQQLYRLTQNTLFSEDWHHVEWIHVPRHAGHPENEIVDRMAQEAAERYSKG
ncbi:MAG: ribonuclease HI [Thermodesulfobacteriota bacterium]